MADVAVRSRVPVGDVDSPAELANLIEADEAELANHRDNGFAWVDTLQVGESA